MPALETQQDCVVANTEIEYAGFWLRVAASLIDTIMLLVLLFPLLSLIYGMTYWTQPRPISGIGDVVLNYIAPGVIVILFWVYKSATPGKMILKMRIVDAKTLQQPKTSQLLVRYLGYYLSAIPLFLGLIWVGIDKRKQGFHDKLAGTLVIKT
ncbi:MAG: putative RDD family membrane protein YckC [Paraglaciecola sp.]|jgi:uncharacterized RDD family membrane protein YckC